jgi:hypothetical protein
MTRYLCLYKSATPEGIPPTADEQERMGALIGEMVQAGVLLSAEGCLPTRLGFRVRQDNGKVTVTDGPFTETKEVVGGIAIIQVPSKDEAIRWTKKFLSVAGDGESEVRQLYEQPAS